MTPIFTGSVANGTLPLDDKRQFTIHLNNLNGKRVQLTLEKVKHRRSNNQNAYYFGVVLKLLSEHTGYEPEELHEALKFKFTEKRYHCNLLIPASTKKLDTIDFEKYLDKIRKWAVEEMRVVIPLPGEITV